MGRGEREVNFKEKSDDCEGEKSGVGSFTRGGSGCWVLWVVVWGLGVNGLFLLLFWEGS